MPTNWSFALQVTNSSMKVKVSVTQSCLTLPSHGLKPAGLLCPWNSPGKNTEVGHALLQGIFLTQGSNPALLHYRQVLNVYSVQNLLYFSNSIAFSLLIFSFDTALKRDSWVKVSLFGNIYLVPFIYNV